MKSIKPAVGQVWGLFADHGIHIDCDPYLYLVIGLKGERNLTDHSLFILYDGSVGHTGTIRPAGSFFKCMCARLIT